MKKRTILSVAILSTILGLKGCTGVNIPDTKELTDIDVVPEAIERFERVQGVTKIYSKTLNIIEQNKIPDEFLNKNINLSLSREATFEDLSEFLFISTGLKLFFTENVFSDDSIVINRFNGTVEDLLDTVSSIYNISFNYSRNGIVFVREKSEFLINIPQDEDIMSEILNGIQGLGAEDVETSLLGGTILYKASPIQQKKIETYIKRFKENAAIIGLQVAVVTVTMDKNNNRGFDWGRMQAMFGPEVGSRRYADRMSGSSSSSEEGGSSVLGNSLSALKAFAEVSSSGTAMSVMKGDFSFNAVINYLSTYGQTRTNQSVLMRTLSGKEVSLRSGQSVPYVSGVSNTSSGTSGNVSSSTETDTAQIGITLQLKPYFDSSSEMVTTEVSLELSSILSFLELSAGNEIGTITQPNTQEQSFTNVITIPAGESTIVGGITYESLSDNRTGISYFEKAKIANKNETINRSAVFILLRPTVTVFVDEK